MCRAIGGHQRVETCADNRCLTLTYISQYLAPGKFMQVLHLCPGCSKKPRHRGATQPSTNDVTPCTVESLITQSRHFHRGRAAVMKHTRHGPLLKARLQPMQPLPTHNLFFTGALLYMSSLHGLLAKDGQSMRGARSPPTVTFQG